MESMNPQMRPGGTSGSPMVLPQPPATGNVAGLPQPPPVMPGMSFPPGSMMPPPGMPVPPMGIPPAMMGPGVIVPPPIPPGVPRPPLIVGGWQPPVVPLNPPSASSTTAPIVTPDLHPSDRFVSTVFVGNISDRAPDALVRQLLMKCGKMNSWKRVQGTAGKLQAFGFCEYADPESTLRALRLLRNFKLGSKSLSVKVDTKSRKDLQKYIIRKKKRKEGKSHDEAMKAAEKEVEEGSLGESLDDVLDDATKDADKQVKALLETIIKENSSAFEGDEDTDLKANVTEAMISMARQTGKIGPDESMEDIDVEVRDRVSDEIKKFRLNYKKSEEDRLKKSGKEKSGDEDSSREERVSKDSGKDTTKVSTSSEEKSSRERRSRREDRTSRDRDRTSRDRDREERRGRSRRSRSGSRHRSRSRSKERRRTKSRSRSRERERDRDEEMEMLRLERKRKERQAAFEERLRKWETRERRKLREHQKMEERDSYKSVHLEKERKKSDRYFADYDDDKDDYHYYRGSAMDEKLQDREREVEEDERDRLKEKQEQVGVEVEADTTDAPPRPSTVEAPPTVEPMEVNTAAVGNSHDSVAKQQKPIPPLEEEPPPPQITAAFHSEYHLSHLKSEEDTKPKVAFSLGSKPAPSTVSSETAQGPQVKPKGLDVFNTDEDDHDEGPKRKPITLPPVEEDNHVQPEAKRYTSEERKKLMKTLVDSIPTSKGDLFSYQIKWEYLDKVLVEKRISPWINKKIVEYIGEEEPALTEFIINSLKQECTPKSLLDEISMILDDEGEVFVVKLWRLLIYETEAKVLGISKVV